MRTRSPPNLRSLGLLVISVGVAGLVMVAIAIFGWWLDIPYKTVTADVVTVAQLHPLTGLISNLGVLLLCSAASVSAFAAYLSEPQGGGRRTLLTATAGLSLAFCLDDLLLVHEDLAMRYLAVPEQVIYAVYACAILGYLALLRVRGRRGVSPVAWLALAVALVLWAGSLGVDHLHGRFSGKVQYLLEDGLKFVGIAAWWAYCLMLAASPPAGDPFVDPLKAPSGTDAPVRG